MVKATRQKGDSKQHDALRLRNQFPSPSFGTIANRRFPKGNRGANHQGRSFEKHSCICVPLQFMIIQVTLLVLWIGWRSLSCAWGIDGRNRLAGIWILGREGPSNNVVCILKRGWWTSFRWPLPQPPFRWSPQKESQYSGNSLLASSLSWFPLAPSHPPRSLTGLVGRRVTHILQSQDLK